MFTKLKHFERAWAFESENTLKILRTLTDTSLSQAISAEERTLGRIAWHVTTSIPEMMERTGLKLEGPGAEAPLPPFARVIAEGYEKVAKSLLDVLPRTWNDESLQQVDDMYGEKWKRGVTLTVLISHQAHHRGQMTVLMRQAGLKVPGVYGPAREEWGGMGMNAPEI